MACRCEADLQTALRFKKSLPHSGQVVPAAGEFSQTPSACLTLYAMTRNASVDPQTYADVKPKIRRLREDTSSEDSDYSDDSDCPHSSIWKRVRITDKAGVNFVRDCNRDYRVDFMKEEYAKYRGVPADALTFEVNGKNVSTTKYIGSLPEKRATGRVECVASWDDAVDGESLPIQLQFVTQEPKTIILREIYMNTTGEYLLTLYAKHVRVNEGKLRMVYDGVRIRPTDTPASLEMENDDVIEVFEESLVPGRKCKTTAKTRSIHGSGAFAWRSPGQPTQPLAG